MAGYESDDHLSQRRNDASPWRRRPADPRTMFFLLLPAAIWAAAAIAVRLSGPIPARSPVAVRQLLLLFYLLPIALVCLIAAYRMAVRQEKGFPALLRGLAWNIGWVVAFAVLFGALPKN
jgi:hypothetical protein